MADSSKTRLAFRYSCSMFHLIGISYNYMEIDLECYQVFGGRLKFLTFINMFLQWIYFTSAAVMEMQALTKKRKGEIFSCLCDLLFACWIFPLGLQVTLMFWSMYAVDPYSLQTEEEAKLIPSSLNHYMHTFPGIAVLFEVLFFKHEYPSVSIGLKAVLGFAVGYTAWVFIILQMGNFWVYPFMEKMTGVQMAGFFGGAYALVVVLYLVGEVLAHKCAYLERPCEKEIKLD